MTTPGPGVYDVQDLQRESMTDRRRRAIIHACDARLPLILRYCYECGSLIEVRFGVVDKHWTNRGWGFGSVNLPCPGKRWRR